MALQCLRARRWTRPKNEKGIVLVASLLILMAVTIVGTTGVTISTTDIKIGGNYKSTKQALYDAEAGVQYVIKQIENGLSGSTLTLPTTLGSSTSISYWVPSGFSFGDSATPTTSGSISLTNVGSNRYRFQVTGRAANNTSSTIEVIIQQDPLLNYGIFGNELVDTKNSATVYSYDSRVIASPTAADSTGEADIGSNEVVIGHHGSYIDGSIGLGDDGSGHEAVYIELPPGGGPTVTGTAGQDVDRVDPDPMGAVGGELATKFAAYSDINDNVWGGTDIISISDNSIQLTSSDGVKTLPGKSGGAQYYVTSITLNNGAALAIDTTDGPVNIYLTGKLEAKEGSAINITGQPPDFTLYSNSTSDITFKHGGLFKGTVYAPFATVEMKNSADVYGLIWAKTVDVKNSGQFYYDAALKDKHLSDNVSIVSWREVK